MLGAALRFLIQPASRHATLRLTARKLAGEGRGSHPLEADQLGGRHEQRNQSKFVQERCAGVITQANTHRLLRSPF
jgi:hypothetical protein